jgi:hypothetical protein
VPAVSIEGRCRTGEFDKHVLSVLLGNSGIPQGLVLGIPKVSGLPLQTFQLRLGVPEFHFALSPEGNGKLAVVLTTGSEFLPNMSPEGTTQAN